MAQGARRGLSRTALILGLVVIVAIAGGAIYVSTGSPSASTSTSSIPPLSVALSPATPLIAPGQTQNYSSLQIQSLGAPLNKTVVLTDLAPFGITFILNRTSIQLGTAASIPVVLRAGAGLQPGNYEVSLTISSGPVTLANKNLTIEVVPVLVVMQNVAYHPQNITVAKGTSVSWINLDSNIGCCDPGSHNVVFLSGANASSPILKRLDSWSYTFGSPGSVDYYCSIHPYMKGHVTVTG